MRYNVTYYDENEEKWNVLTHGIGFLLSLIAFPFILNKAIKTADAFVIISYIIYGVSMILLYASSTLYHSTINNKLRYYLNILDHSAIYVLIAGSYAPIALVVLGGKVGWLVFGISWIIAIVGIVYKFYFIEKYRILSVLSYIAMGWLIVFFVKPLIHNFSSNGLQWLLWGGIFYSIGAYFFAANQIKYNHAIFHVWVLLGSLCHFVAIYYYAV